MLNVLLPLDGSEMAERVVPHALSIASSFACNVVLLRVVTPSEFRVKETFNRVDWRLHKRQAHAYLQSVAQTFHAASVQCDLRIVEGQPAEAILETARELGCRLLVLSTHGRGSATDFSRGGVAGKVLSAFDESVLLVGANVTSPSSVETGYRHLFVPIDGSQRSECALRVGVMLAESLGAKLTVACIVEHPELPSILRREQRAQELLHELTTLSRLAADRRFNELRAQIPECVELDTTTLVSSSNLDNLDETVRRSGADLVITSTSIGPGRTGPAETLFAKSGVPVLALEASRLGEAFCELVSKPNREASGGERN